MPGPIGVGRKIARTYTAYRREQAVANAVERGGGRTLADDVTDVGRGRSLFGSRAVSAASRTSESSINEDAYYSMAISMCGNAGQVAIIESMGVSAFSEAGTAHNDGGDAGDTLIFLCPYPEAVEDILGEVGGEMADDIENQWDSIDEEEEEEEEEGPF